jgi:glycolate oxidase FAD binding subunit
MPNSISPPIFVNELTAISGFEHLRIQDGVLNIEPANTEEIAAILRCADKGGFSVIPYGGGTKQSWGNPVQPSVILHTHRIDTVLEHTWQDMTCTVEAGCLWSAMQSSLSNHGQFVALDPLWPDQATIGGVAATNDSGSLRLRYGSLRDLVIGMTVVLADGTIARSGGKVVKNVAGYDLHKLMTGAFGTLGIITEVTFRLYAIPKNVQSFTIFSPDVEPLGRLLQKLLDSHLSMQSLQLRSSLRGFDLDIKLATLPEVINDQASALVNLAQSVQLEASSLNADMWNARQEIFRETETFLIKATMLPAEISHFATAIRALGGTSVTQAFGIMIASLPLDACRQLEYLREKLEAIRGSLTILRSPAGATAVASTTPSDTLPLMRELKRSFDPNRILNPGRFLGGI